MSDINNHSGAITVTEKANNFLKKTTPIFLAFFVAAIIVISIVAGINIVSTNMKSSAPEIAEKIEKTYQAWLVEDDESKKNAFETEITNETQTLAASFPKSFSFQRALIIEGSIYYEKKDYANSIVAWSKVAELFRDSYLSSIALQKAAISADELGDIDKAIELYNKLIERYSKKIPGIPHAYWSLARLYEQKKDFQLSRKFYDQLLNEYPDDENWTKLAQSRIIFLDTQGFMQK